MIYTRCGGLVGKTAVLAAEGWRLKSSVWKNFKKV